MEPGKGPSTQVKSAQCPPLPPHWSHSCRLPEADGLGLRLGPGLGPGLGLGLRLGLGEGEGEAMGPMLDQSLGRHW